MINLKLILVFSIKALPVEFLLFMLLFVSDAGSLLCLHELHSTLHRNLLNCDLFGSTAITTEIENLSAVPELKHLSSLALGTAVWGY